jgi:hypothetical protein
MYDFYRKYLWDKEEPKAIRNVSGSAGGIAAPGRSFN